MKKILVVDDDLIIRELVQELLEMSNKFSKVDAADEGKSALDKISSENYDIILTDINMPNGMSGFELIDIVSSKKIIVGSFF